MLKLLFADESGQVFEHPELLAVARDGFPLEQPEPLPVHATLAALPGRRPLGFDPASASAPFVATLVDVTGLSIYFYVALLILRGTLL